MMSISRVATHFSHNDKNLLSEHIYTLGGVHAIFMSISRQLDPELLNQSAGLLSNALYIYIIDSTHKSLKMISLLNLLWAC